MSWLKFVICLFWVKSSVWKGYMYAAVAVGSIQKKCWLIVAEGESGNSTVAEGGIMVTGKSGVER